MECHNEKQILLTAAGKLNGGTENLQEETTFLHSLTVKVLLLCRQSVFL
jgi:hypothetical protein